MNRILTIIFILYLTLPIRGQDSLNVNQEVVIDQRVEQQILLLEEKVDILNETNDKILRTIYFTIGTLLTVLIGIGVLNAFSNYKLNSEKFKQLKDELELKLKENYSASQNSINQQLSAIEENSEKNKKKLLSSISNKIDSASDSKMADTNNKVKRLNEELVQLKIYNLESYMDIGIGQYISQYSTIDNYSKLLEWDTELYTNGLDWIRVDITDRLKQIKEVLEKREITLKEKKRLLDSLNSLPEKYNDAVDLVKEKIKATKISDY